MKPGGSAHPLMDRVTPLAPEQVIMGKLHLPALGTCLSCRHLFPQGWAASSLPSPVCFSSHHLSAHLPLPLRPLAGPGEELKTAVKQVLWGRGKVGAYLLSD